MNVYKMSMIIRKKLASMRLPPTPLCMFLSPSYRVLYLKFTYGSQFSEEKNDLEICSLVPEILNKQTFERFCLKALYGVQYSKSVRGILISPEF